MEKISWMHSVRNEEVLRRVKEDRNILNTIKRRKANWNGHCSISRKVAVSIPEGVFGIFH
jgi:hypothetical protein